jgi:hypothetical protein
MTKKINALEKPRFNSAGYQGNIKDLNGETLPNISKVDFQPLKHGGARRGAGRKPSGRKGVLLRLSPKVISALRNEAERKNQTLSDVAEERLARL